MTIDIGTINWELLRKQKEFLHKIVVRPETGDDEVLLANGLLELVEHIQDEAAETIGEITVFGNLEER